MSYADGWKVAGSRVAITFRDAMAFWRMGDVMDFLGVAGCCSEGPKVANLIN